LLLIQHSPRCSSLSSSYLCSPSRLRPSPRSPSKSVPRLAEAPTTAPPRSTPPPTPPATMSRPVPLPEAPPTPTATTTTRASTSMSAARGTSFPLGPAASTPEVLRVLTALSSTLLAARLARSPTLVPAATPLLVAPAPLK
ncbi:hypothetical protein CI238_10874, partial [Colletotrichum incanum]